MHHPRYYLTHHPGISSNITNTTYLERHPCHPRQHNAHCTHIGAPPRHSRCHVTHTGMSPTLARHQRKHTTHTRRSPMQARYLRHPRQHKQHAISQAPWYLFKLLKLLALTFQEEIQQSLLSVFIFKAFSFKAFLSIFVEVWKTTTEKLNFFRGNYVCLIQKTTIFFKKECADFFRKDCFLIFVVLAILFKFGKIVY